MGKKDRSHVREKGSVAQKGGCEQGPGVPVVGRRRTVGKKFGIRKDLEREKARTYLQIAASSENESESREIEGKERGEGGGAVLCPTV